MIEKAGDATLGNGGVFCIIFALQSILNTHLQLGQYKNIERDLE